MEALYLRALGILEEALGPDHNMVATALNNLAEVYRSQVRGVVSPCLRLVSVWVEEGLAESRGRCVLGKLFRNTFWLQLIRAANGEGDILVFDTKARIGWPLHRNTLAPSPPLKCLPFGDIQGSSEQGINCQEQMY